MQIDAPPVIHAIFEADLQHCLIVLSGGLVYEGLSVKRMRDIPKDEVLFIVLVPCEADLGHRLMVAFDWEAVQGYRKSGL